MNILTEQLPESVEVDGVQYPVYTDFRNALKTILAFEDGDLTDAEKCAVMLDNLYIEIPPDASKALEAATRFLNGGRQEGESPESDLRLYSFIKDGNYIFAAFRQTHGIDLETAELHWWKFLALFMDLGTETTFCSLVAFRRRIKTGKATKEEQKEYRENRDFYDVPEIDTRSMEERIKEAEFMRLVRGGK